MRRHDAPCRCFCFLLSPTNDLVRFTSVGSFISPGIGDKILLLGGVAAKYIGSSRRKLENMRGHVLAGHPITVLATVEGELSRPECEEMQRFNL